MNTNVPSLAVSGNDIFAATDGSGVWRRPLSEIMGVFDQKTPRENIQQAHFKISPSNRACLIVAVEFTIPHSDQVAIKMYNLAGREISSIVNQYLNEGAYKYFWDTHTFVQGCYAVRMQVGATTCIKTIQIVH